MATFQDDYPVCGGRDARLKGPLPNVGQRIVHHQVHPDHLVLRDAV
jgi:hypothetical protein